MGKWKTIRDCRFFATEEDAGNPNVDDGYIVIKKGSILKEVEKITPEIMKNMHRIKNNDSDKNSVVYLFAEGKYRYFSVNKSVMPVKTKRMWVKPTRRKKHE